MPVASREIVGKIIENLNYHRLRNVMNVFKRCKVFFSGMFVLGRGLNPSHIHVEMNTIIRSLCVRQGVELEVYS